MTVFKLLTTFVSGYVLWICSAKESILEIKSDGGIPFEKSSGFEISSIILPARFSFPADSNAGIVPIPFVAFTTNSLKDAASEKNTHIVKRGESLGSISELYNVRINDLKEWNNLKDNNIKAGQELAINKTIGNVQKNITKNASSDRVHMVKEGESLWTIAKLYKVLVADIMNWNNLKTDRVKIGQRLKILI